MTSEASFASSKPCTVWKTPTHKNPRTFDFRSLEERIGFGFVRFPCKKYEYFVKTILIRKEILGIYALLVEIFAKFV